MIHRDGELDPLVVPSRPGISGVLKARIQHQTIKRLAADQKLCSDPLNSPEIGQIADQGLHPSGERVQGLFSPCLVPAENRQFMAPGDQIPGRLESDSGAPTGEQQPAWCITGHGA